MSEVSDKVRTEFGKSDEIRDAGLTIPEDVERYTDLVYGDDPDWQVLDVYRPACEQGKTLPVIVSIHGGGWVYGDKNLYQYYCMSLAQRGFAVVNFTYRLAPEFKFPASLEDTNLVMKWILDNGADYGMDLTNIFGVGDSAGAHALGLYTAIYTNPAYAAEYDFTVPTGLNLRAIALNCGCYRITTDGENDRLTALLMQDLMPNGGDADELALITVTNHITDKFLPTIYATCPGDFLKDQAPILAERLMANNIPHEFIFLGSNTNPLGHVFHLNMREPLGTVCNDLECEFFRRHIV